MIISWRGAGSGTSSWSRFSIATVLRFLIMVDALKKEEVTALLSLAAEIYSCLTVNVRLKYCVALWMSVSRSSEARFVSSSSASSPASCPGCSLMVGRMLANLDMYAL